MTDQLKRAMELDAKSGAFEMDEAGYLRFQPSDEELAEINRWISDETDIAEDEYKPIYAEAREDTETYKASKSSDVIDGEQTILPAPLARIAVDQIVAWLFNTIMRPLPIVSLQPYFHDTYQVPVMGVTQDPMTGEPIRAPMIEEVAAEDVASYIETGYDFKLRENIDFADTIFGAIQDCAVVSRGYVKVCHERIERPILEPKVNGAVIDFGDLEERYTRDGDVVSWYSVPLTNMLKRVQENDFDRAEWMSERIPCSPEEFRARCMKGEYFILTDAEVDDLARQFTDARQDDKKDAEELTQNRHTSTPRNMIDLREVWFYRYLKFKDPENEDRTTIKKVSLMGHYHRTARKMVSIFRNPYQHQMRPYAVFYQLKDAHDDSGASTTSISRFFQKVATHVMQAEIKTRFHHNNPLYWYEPNSQHAGFWQGGKKRVSAGDVIPGKEGEDWGRSQAGFAAGGSMVEFLQFIKGWTREAQNLSSYESGDNIPGRTPAATMSQILQQGLQQPIMFLRGIDRGVRRLIRLDMETRRQYQPMGEVIPTKDERTKAIVNIPFRLPLGEVGKNFRCSLTAADEAMAREHEPDQLLMVMNVWQGFTQYVAQIMQAMKDPNATPEDRQFFMQCIKGAQAVFDRVMMLMRTDRDKFDLSKPAEAIEQAANMMQMQMMQQQQMMGGMNGTQNPAAQNAGGEIPGPVGGDNGGGLEGAGIEPGIPSDLVPPPAASVPAPPPIQ